MPGQGYPGNENSTFEGSNERGGLWPVCNLARFYTSNVRKYLDQKLIIYGVNGVNLVDLILKYYDPLAEKDRRMIPLKMVYIPCFRSNKKLKRSRFSIVLKCSASKGRSSPLDSIFQPNTRFLFAPIMASRGSIG